MSTEASIDITKILAGNPAVRLARILGLDGEYLEQADVTSVTYVVRDLDNASAQIATGSFTPSACLYNQMQTGQIWPTDNIGYNFKATLPGTCFPLASRRYRATFTFVTGAAEGNPQHVHDYHTISTTGA